MFRRAVTNNLTAAFARRGADITIEEVLDNSDLGPSLRNEVPVLFDFIIPDGSSDAPHLKQFLEFALHPTMEQQALSNFNKYSARATSCLSTASNKLFARLRRNKVFMDELADFIGNRELMGHPVFAGHFHPIVLALARRHPDVLEKELRRLLIGVVNHIDLLGWQDALVCLASDLPDFGAPFRDPLDAFRYLAHRARLFAKRGDDHDSDCLIGLCTAVARIIDERTAENSAFFCMDVTTVHGFTKAVTHAASSNRPAAIRWAVRLLARIANVAAKAVKNDAAKDGEKDPAAPVRRLIRCCGDALYDSLTSPESHQMKAHVFPAFWRSGISLMVDRFFEQGTADGQFKRAFVNALKRMYRKKPVRFHRFVRDQYILARFKGLWVLREPPNVLENPYEFALLRLITQGRCCDKKPRVDYDAPPVDPPTLETLPEDRTEFADFAIWVRERLNGDVRFVSRQWKAVARYLK